MLLSCEATILKPKWCDLTFKDLCSHTQIHIGKHPEKSILYIQATSKFTQF